MAWEGESSRNEMDERKRRRRAERLSRRLRLAENRPEGLPLFLD